MTRTRRFLGGLSLGYLYLAIVTIAGLWLTPFILRHVGQQDFGLWLAGAQIVAYIGLLDLGVIALVPRETAYITGRSGGSAVSGELPGLVSRTAVIVLAQMPLVAIGAALVFFHIPSEWKALQGPLAIVLASFVVCFPLRLLPALVQGLQDLAFLAKVHIASWLLGTVVTIGLLMSGAGLYSMAIGGVLTQVAPVPAAWIRLRQRHRSALPRRVHPMDWDATRRQIVSSLWLSIAQISHAMLNASDVILVAWFFGPSVAVVYSCTGKLATVLANQPQILAHTAGPALSELKAAGNHQRLFQASSALTLALMLVSGAVVCVVLGLNMGFVGWWVGAELYGGNTLTALFLAAMLLRHWNVTLVYTLFCFGYERRTSLVGLADGMVMLTAALLLTRVAGPAGVLLASILSVSLISLPVNLRTLAREVGSSVPAVVAVLAPWFWRFAAIAGVIAVAVSHRAPSTFVGLGLTGAATLLVYAISMASPALQPPLGIYTRPVLDAFLAFVRRPLARESMP
jgi:O-antigen/teichoic acid export membrane protein